ncbi:hypothetical protein H2199_006618 [Coniosporium tulheliwenetii]|uniref:Uncharacterized protein n=1 Tax=Coniosporium tulheliwenetii TaxID=3383036 RepID=A0ACC2YTT8_9PEZI|nr:hypothetical protein H2199_006618 [Cladosporium sp. JES 115]
MSLSPCSTPSPGAPPRPLLVLLHGYPQTSFMWRHLIKLLPSDLPLFIPDLPGYGRSTPSTTGHDKRTIGLAVLEALDTLLGQTSGLESSYPIVLGGHDRGARICHRLAVDFPNLELALDSRLANLVSQRFRLENTLLLDILPTLEQWRSFSKSTTAAGSYHWSFLANMPLAFDMIKAYGPAKYCKDLITRWQGNNPASLHSDNAVEVYAAAFENDEVVRATCEDYVAGAGVDVEEQEKDQQAGRKMGGIALANASLINSWPVATATSTPSASANTTSPNVTSTITSSASATYSHKHSATTSPTAAPSNDTGPGSLSTGAKAGIGVGAGSLALSAALLFYLRWRRRRRPKHAYSLGDSDSTEQVTTRPGSAPPELKLLELGAFEKPLEFEVLERPVELEARERPLELRDTSRIAELPG